MDWKKCFKKSEEGEGKCGKACKCGSGIYCLGFLGAAIYYITTATSFGAGVVGVLKALVWPASLIFEAFKFLGL